MALDSAFAWAHASLGLAADWLDGQGAGAPHFAIAESLLDRVTEKERLWIRSLIRSGQERVDALRSYTQLWPDDRDAWYNLGNNLRALNRPDEALEAYNRAIQVDSLCQWCYVNSAMVFDLLNRNTEAAAAFDRAFTLNPPSRTQVMGDLNRFAGFVLVKVGDTAQAASLFTELLTGDAEVRANGLRSLALLDMYRGQADNAIGRLREASTLTASSGAKLSELRNRLYLASALEMKGMRADAAAERLIADRIAREIAAGPSWLTILGKQFARAGDTVRARSILTELDTQVGPEASAIDRSAREMMRGELAIATGDTATAESALLAANGLWRAPDRLESVAYGAFMAERWDAAADAYSELLAAPRLGDELQAYWIESHHRYGHVLEQTGDTAGAIESYRRFLELWKAGDADLAGVDGVRDRISRLSGVEVGR